MSNEKMREAFDKLLSKNEGQFSNTSFSIFKEGYQAALAQQSEPAKCVDDGGNCGAGGYCGKCEPARVSQAPAMWIAPSGEGFRISLGTKKPEHAELWEAVYLAPPDYEALLAKVVMLENNSKADDRLINSADSLVQSMRLEAETLKSRVVELEDQIGPAHDLKVIKQIDYLAAHRDELEAENEIMKMRVAEWQRMYETNRETIDKLQSRVAEYKASAEKDAKILTKFHSDRERLRGKLFEAETDRDNAILERDKLKTLIEDIKEWDIEQFLSIPQPIRSRMQSALGL